MLAVEALALDEETFCLSVSQHGTSRVTICPQEATGFKVRIREKTHHTIFELLEARVTTIDEVLPDHASLLITGNCILLAVWHLLPELRAKISQSLAAAVASNSL